MLARTASVLLAALLPTLAPIARPSAAQATPEPGRADALGRYHSDLHDLVWRLEQAQGVLFAELADVRDDVADRGADGSATRLEADLVDRLTRIVREQEVAEEASAVAASGYATLGPRGAEIVQRAQAFQREVMSILADPEVEDADAALAGAVRAYRSRPETALPAAPKDMDILYGHDYALAFRSGYGDPGGLLWAGRWLRLAATEPLTDLPPGPERTAGIDTVTTRYDGKLSDGQPPRSFPSELPLAPAIAPGLVWASPESAMIWDNLSMLLEVLADILASPETVDPPRAIEAALDFFVDPELAVTDRDDWEIMALRHGIFFQGGFPLAVMTRSERNVDGHAAHLASGRIMAIPGMPRR